MVRRLSPRAFNNTRKRLLKGEKSSYALVVLLLRGFFGPNASLGRPHWPGQFWDDTPITYVFSSTLDNLDIDGDTGQQALAETLISNGAEKWNDVGTDFQLNEGSSGGNIVSASSIDGSGDILAITTTNWNVVTLEIINNDTVYDTAELWQSDEDAVFNPILEYVATHEFGHWVHLEDVGDDAGENPNNPPTTMGWLYNKNLYTDVLTHDASTLEDVYP